jgi:hypothetical protein
MKESLAVLAGQGYTTHLHYPLFAYFPHTQDSQQSITSSDCSQDISSLP